MTRALALLGEDNRPNVPIVVIHRPALVGSPERAVASTDGRSFVRVYDDTDVYKRAVKGDARALAAALVHEAFHVTHGPAEGPAYAEQLRVLRALGAQRRDIQPVERAAHFYPLR